MRFRKRIENSGDGIGEKTSRKIADFAVDEEGLYRSRGVIASRIDGIGEKTLDKLGIWDENGDPVNELPEKPCPICHNEYITKKTTKGSSVDTTGASEVCVETNQFDSTCYLHE